MVRVRVRVRVRAWVMVRIIVRVRLRVRQRIGVRVRVRPVLIRSLFRNIIQNFDQISLRSFELILTHISPMCALTGHTGVICVRISSKSSHEWRADSVFLIRIHKFYDHNCDEPIT